MQDETKQHDVQLEDFVNARDIDNLDKTKSDNANYDPDVANLEKDTKIAELEQKLKTKEQLDNLIEPCARKSFLYMNCYSGGVLLIILLNGFGCFTNKLDSETINFLVGSTAVTVIGLVALVITGVFSGARRN